MSLRSLALVSLALGIAGPIYAQPTSDTLNKAQAVPTMALRTRVRELLAKSPLLDPTMSVVREAQFVRDAQAALAGTPWAFKAESALDATRALEAILADEIVTAKIVSVPSGIVVSYRRLVDPNAPALNVTSDDSLRLEPATYQFWATPPSGGANQVQRVPCLSGCNVKFVFGKTK